MFIMKANARQSDLVGGCEQIHFFFLLVRVEIIGQFVWFSALSLCHTHNFAVAGTFVVVVVCLETDY